MTRGNRKEKEELDNISPALFIRSFIQRICLEHLSWIPNEGFEQRNKWLHWRKITTVATGERLVVDREPGEESAAVTWEGNSQSLDQGWGTWEREQVPELLKEKWLMVRIHGIWEHREGTMTLFLTWTTGSIRMPFNLLCKREWVDRIWWESGREERRWEEMFEAFG